MRNALVRLLQHWQYGVLELLLYFPAVLAAGILLCRHEPLWLWIGTLPAVYLLAIVLYNVLGVQTSVYHLVTAALIGGLWVTFGFGWTVAGIALFALCLVCWFRGMLCARIGWNRPYPEHHYWIGLALYFVTYFFYRYIPVLHPYLPVFSWAGFVAIVISFYFMNNVHLQNISFAGQEKPLLSASMVRHNRIHTTVIVIIVFAVASFKQIEQFFAGLYHGLVRWVGYLLSRLATRGSRGTPADLRPTQQLPALEQGQPSPFLLFLEKIAKYVVLAIVAVGLTIVLAFVLYKLAGLAVKAVLRLLKWLRERREDASFAEGYSDEEETLVKLGSWGADYIHRFRQWLADLLEREPRWEDLATTRDKVRFLYRHWVLRSIQKGYSYKPWLTPRETGRDLSGWRKNEQFPADRLISLYYETRYGNREVDAEPVEELHRKLRQMDH